MRFNLTLLLKTTLLSGVITLMTNMPSWAGEVVNVDKHSTLQSDIGNGIGNGKENTNQNLEDKLYRQALYFYFTGDYGEALRKISINRQRFSTNSPRTPLFEAGLLVSIGLHHQATKTLYQLEEKQVPTSKSSKKDSVTEKSTDNGTSATSPEELLLIALLQLAEQQIQQGENKFAQHSLSKITQVSNTYHDQYRILNQLAYWPGSPDKLLEISKSETSNQASSTSTSAYVALNQALLYIEQAEFEKAMTMLAEIKNKQWQAPSMTFWQLLFNPVSDELGNDNTEKTNTEITRAEKNRDEKSQQQAVNDYAKLLLAQVYVKQAQYESAYYELKNFPQDSPYSESALFIFAFSAHKTKQYTTSRKLFDLMQERYPYSNLGWQAALLLAGQIADQKTIEQGMTSYQNAEKLYQQRLTDLADFHHDFMASDDVLNFSTAKETMSTSQIPKTSSLVTQKPIQIFTQKSTQQTYMTESIWLQKALIDVELQADYQAVMELDLLSIHLKEQQEISIWLQDTLILNNNRKAKVVELQQQSQYSAIINGLNDKKQQVSAVITQAETEQQGQAFANATETQWLKGIKESKQAITLIKNHRNIDDYQERLTRIEGVLAWQLQQTLPDRLWRHKKQLQVIEQQLIAAEQQRKRFAALASSPSMLSGMEDRIKKSSVDVIVLLDHITELRAKTSNKIQEKVQHFVDSQRDLLGQHLLTSRHEMAAVLEKMSQVDKRIEMQLAPSVKQPNIPSSKSSVLEKPLSASSLLDSSLLEPKEQK